jgi:hypothetical protein
MPYFEVNWAVGGREVIEADTREEAQEIMAERMSKTEADWQDIEAIEQPKVSVLPCPSPER